MPIRHMHTPTTTNPLQNLPESTQNRIEQHWCSLASPASFPPVRLLYARSQRPFHPSSVPPFRLGLHAPPCEQCASQYVLFYYHFYFISFFVWFPLLFPYAYAWGYVLSTIIYIFAVSIEHAGPRITIRRGMAVAPSRSENGKRRLARERTT